MPVPSPKGNLYFYRRHHSLALAFEVYINRIILNRLLFVFFLLTLYLHDLSMLMGASTVFIRVSVCVCV